MKKEQYDNIKEALEYAENIISTIREPLLVLGSDLKIISANTMQHPGYNRAKETRTSP
jgi:hypothetical protein